MPSTHKTLGECLKTLGITADNIEEFFDGCFNVKDEFSRVRKAWRKGCLKNHPDKGGDAKIFRVIQTSFETMRTMFSKGHINSFVKNGSQSTAEEYDNLSEEFDSSETPSWEYFYEAENVEEIPYRVELAKSGRSTCKNTSKTNPCLNTEIPRGSVRIGIMDAESGDYGWWRHVKCWRVPEKIWSGLPNPENSPDFVEFEKCLMRMNEVLLSGLGDMTEKVKRQIVKHCMNSTNWASYAKKKNAKAKKELQKKKKLEREAKKKKTLSKKIDKALIKLNKMLDTLEKVRNIIQNEDLSKSKMEKAKAKEIRAEAAYNKAKKQLEELETKMNQMYNTKQKQPVEESVEIENVDVISNDTKIEIIDVISNDTKNTKNTKNNSNSKSDTSLSAISNTSVNSNSIVKHSKQRTHFTLPIPGKNGADPEFLKGKTIVITGVFPEVGSGSGLNLGKGKIKKMVIAFGGRVTTAVSGKTDILIVGKEPGRTKVRKAKSIPKIKRMTIQELKLCIEGNSSLANAKTAKITSFSRGYHGKAKLYVKGDEDLMAIEVDDVTETQDENISLLSNSTVTVKTGKKKRKTKGNISLLSNSTVTVKTGKKKRKAKENISLVSNSTVIVKTEKKKRKAKENISPILSKKLKKKEEKPRLSRAKFIKEMMKLRLSQLQDRCQDAHLDSTGKKLVLSKRLYQAEHVQKKL